MAPFERVLKRAVTVALRASGAALMIGLALETLGDLGDAERRDACRDELDRERDPVEPQADLGDRLARPRVPGCRSFRRRLGPAP